MPTSRERCQYNRWVPEVATFAVFRPEVDRLGPISDISHGGVGSTYLIRNNDKFPSPHTPQIIDIISSEGSFYLSNIPCSLIHDKAAEGDQLSFMPDLVNRLCGLKFDRLTADQQDQLKYLLETHTVGSA